MRVRRTGWTWAAILSLGLLMGACGDSNVFEGMSDDSGDAAKQEEGLDALNNGNYDQAAKIFEALWRANPTAENAKYLASAYIGQSGFDTLTLIEEIAKFQEMDGSAASKSIIYDAVTNLFDQDGDGTISKPELDAKTDFVAKAVSVLVPDYASKAGLLRAAPAASASSDDQIFQSGLYAAIHAVLGVVGQLQYPTDSGNYLLTLEELQAHLGEIILNVKVPQGFEEDLALVDAAREVLVDRFTGGTGSVEDNDIAQEFDEFLREIGYLPDLDVTDSELQQFLTSLIQ